MISEKVLADTLAAVIVSARDVVDVELLSVQSRWTRQISSAHPRLSSFFPCAQSI